MTYQKRTTYHLVKVSPQRTITLACAKFKILVNVRIIIFITSGSYVLKLPPSMKLLFMKLKLERECWFPGRLKSVHVRLNSNLLIDNYFVQIKYWTYKTVEFINQTNPGCGLITVMILDVSNTQSTILTDMTSDCVRFEPLRLDRLDIIGRRNLFDLKER